MASQNEIRQNITNQIVEALKSGDVPPWRRPWKLDDNAGSATNIVSRKRYRGVNPLLLEMASMRHGLQSKWWATFNQWKQLGGKVKRRPDHVPQGQWGTQIVWWSPITKKDTDQDGNETEDRFFVLKCYCVFNLDQVDGPFDHLRVGGTASTTPAPQVPYQRAEDAIGATQASIQYGGSRAFYSPSDDIIRMPHRELFTEIEEYYQTASHELCHWTGHPSRLNRLVKNAHFGDTAYACEELVAELGGCFLARELGVPNSQDLGNNVAYLQNWIEAMKGDPSFIFTASGQASKAADHILSFSEPADASEAPEPEGVLVGSS